MPLPQGYTLDSDGPSSVKPPQGYSLDGEEPQSTEWTGSHGVMSKPAAPAPRPQLSDLPGNILPSLGHFADALGSAVAHPINTLKGTAGIALGGLERGAEKVGSLFQSEGADPQEHIDPEHAQIFDAFTQAMTHRYGSLEAARNTAITDPVGFAADVASLANGMSGALGAGADAARSANFVRLGRLLGETAGTASTTATWLDPVANMIRITRGVGTGAGKLISATLGTSTGRGMRSIEEAFKSSKDFKDYMRASDGPADLLNKLKEAVQDLKTKRSVEYQSQLRTLPNVPIDLTAVRNDAVQALKDFNVGLSMRGNTPVLKFRGSAIPKNDEAAMQAAVQDLYSWGTNAQQPATTLGVDILKRRIGNNFIPGSPTGAFTRRLEAGVESELNKVAGYQDMTKGYHTASDMLRQIEAEMSLNAKSPATTMNKLTAAFRRNTEFRTTLADAIHDSLGGFDFNAARAGANMHDLLPEQMRGVLDIFAMAHSNSLPEFAKHALYTGITSPRLVGETLALLGNIRNATRPVTSALRQVAVDNPLAYRAGMYGKQAISDVPFAPDDEAGIEQVMKDHGWTRQQVVQYLQQKGLLHGGEAPRAQAQYGN